MAMRSDFYWKIDISLLPLNIQIESNAQSNHCQIIEF